MKSKLDSLDLQNEFDRGVFLVSLQAIIHDGDKILIGKRGTPDPYIPDLTWAFPGGQPKYDKGLEQSLKENIKNYTSLDITIKSLCHARLYPTHSDILLLYYLAEPISGSVIPGDKYEELLWVKPSEITNYFTSHTDDEIFRILKNLN